MRKLFTLALLCSVLFASCSDSDSNYDNGENTLGSGGNAVLQISFDNETIPSRAETGDRQLKTATIFTLDKNDRITNSFYEGDMATRDANKEYAVTTAVKKVVIVGNAGNLTSTTGYLSDLNSIMKKIDDMSTAATTGVWMTGISTETFTFTETSPTDPDIRMQSCAITMQLIPAKVTVVANNNLSNTSTLTIKDVSFLYSGQYTHLMPQRTKASKYNDIYAPTFSEVAALAGTPTYYVSGFSWNVSGVKGGTVYAPLKQDWNGSSQFEHTYYVLPGNVVPTDATNYSNAIVTITAERAITNPTPNTETEYFSIFFNESTKHVKEYLSSGKHYTITLTLNNDPGGPDEPDVETDATIKISIAIDDWTAVTVSKTFE